MRDMTDEVLAEGKRLWKQNKKLEQKLNEIHNNVIGLQRCHELDRLAMELETEAEIMYDEWNLEDVEKYGDQIAFTVERRLAKERHDQLVIDALYLRRLEYDLITLNNVVNGRVTRAGKKYDVENWRGERP